MEINNNRYNMIDVLRLVLAVLVVSIHTSALLSFGENAWIATSLSIARLAVPFFFIVTGYFFYQKIKQGKETKSYIKRLIKFYVTWVAIELVLLLPMVIPVIKENPMMMIVSLLLFGVTGSLWYISSLVIGLVVSKPLLKRDKFILLFVISACLFVIGLVGDSYFGIFEGTILGKISAMYTSVFKMSNVGVTCSVPFIVIGAAINKFNLKDKIKYSGVISIIGIGLVILEAFILTKNGIAKDYNMYISLLVAVPAVFIWALNSKINISNKNAKICREYSIGIYCTHQTFMMYGYTFLRPLMQFSLVAFAITLILATLGTFILTKFKFTRKHLLLSE